MILRRSTATLFPYTTLFRSAQADGRPLSLAALRYAILTRTELETGPVEVPAERFMINVVVPAMTLMGYCDAPALLDRSEEHTSELQSRGQLVCRLLPEKQNDEI